jgi:antitoxin component YwqK of YwqJK toxin-antitoxin module
MKKMLVIPIFLVIFSCSTTKTTLTKNGKEEIGNLIGGLKEGRWNSYEDGRLISSGNYSKNQQTGHWKYYYPNGRIHRKGKSINDKQNGTWYYYFENGQLMGTGKLIDNEQDGLWKWFYNNGNLYTERVYDKGRLLEIKSCFDKNGGQLDCGKITNGNGIMIFHNVESETDTIQRFEFEKGILKNK